MSSEKSLTRQRVPFKALKKFASSSWRQPKFLTTQQAHANFELRHVCKRNLSIFHILILISCTNSVIVNALDFQTATTVLSILGKALVCIAFSVVYVHSSELFPTEVRNVALGTASMCARISSLAAPYVGAPLVNSHLLL